MSRENKSKYAVLGVLSLGPMTGYDVKKTIEMSLGNFWSESYGQIYPILKDLVAEGLATVETEIPLVGANRRVYTITPTGRKELRRWLERPPEHNVARIEILLKLFFGWQVPPEESRKKVEEYRQLQQDLLTHYDGIEERLRAEQTDHPGLPYWLMTIGYGRHVTRALIDWCDESLATLESLEDVAGNQPGAGTAGDEDGEL
jgi:DNA-binding PadR family transcriptional regulator